MQTERSSPGCGIDSVEITRIEKLLDDLEPDEIGRLFTDQELEDAGEGAGRAASLAARFAAKEACCKLFPKETALGTVEPASFGVRKDGYGAPRVEADDRGQAVMDRYRISAISLSLTHTGKTASAVALAEWKEMPVPWYGKVFYHLFPWRRQIVLENLGRVYGDVVPEKEMLRIAQAYYGHFFKFAIEFLKMPFRSKKKQNELVRIENLEALERAYDQKKGTLILTGHFGNWEVSTVAGIGKFEDWFGKFHFVRRPLNPAILDRFIRERMRRSGFGVLSKQNSLDDMLSILGRNEFVICPFDQHSGGRKAIVVDFFGHPAGSIKSLAIIAQSTGAPVVPASSWREPDGTHVLRFDEAISLQESEDAGDDIRKNTRAFNAALERIILRHPEQWIWMHRRWKVKAKSDSSSGA